MTKKLVGIFIFTVFFVSFIFAEPLKLVVLHTNDIHGHLAAYPLKKNGPLIGGYARMFTYISEVRKNNKHVFLLSAGDIYQGTVYFSIFLGIPDIEFMNKMKYTAMCLGNHEFGIDFPYQRKVFNKVSFPIVCCNIEASKIHPLYGHFKPYIIKEIVHEDKIYKIGIIGVITEDLYELVASHRLKGITVKPMLKTVAEFVKKLKKECDFIIVLSHIGLGPDLELAATVNNIDLIVGGHSHHELHHPIQLINPSGYTTYIVQAGEHGAHIGKVDIELQFKNGKLEKKVKGKLIRLDENIKPDSEILKKVKILTKFVDEKVKQEIGQTKVVLNGERRFIRTQETNLGNLICDAMLDFTGADIAVQNGGGIRATVFGPKITRKDILNVLPFGNNVAIVHINGRQLKELFKMVAERRMAGNFGGFLQVSRNIHVVYGDGKLISLSVDGKPVEDEKIYKLATSDFVARGGDGATVLTKASKFLDTQQKVADVVIEYIIKKKCVSPKVTGRIEIKDK